MKKIKIILPILAFVFAIMAAFASNSAEKSAGGIFAYEVSPGVCDDCFEAEPGAEINCDTGKKVACECMDNGEDLYLWETCEPLSRDE